MTVELTSQLKGLQDLNTRDVQNRCSMMFPHQFCSKSHHYSMPLSDSSPQVASQTFFFQVVKFSKHKKELGMAKPKLGHA